MDERDEFDKQAERLVDHCRYCDRDWRCPEDLAECRSAVAAALREAWERVELHDGWRQETHKIALKVTSELIDRVNNLLREVERLRDINQAICKNLLEWVDSRIEAEVVHRPDINVHKRTLSETWNQVRRYAIEMQNGATVKEPQA